MADVFNFNGASIIAPGFLLRSTVSANRVLQLLPFGTICMVGASDGGLGSGAAYRFTDITVAQRILRSGPLLSALQTAASLGGASGFVAVTAGTKTAAHLTVTAGASTGLLSAGDAGAYTNQFAYKVQAGTVSPAVAVTFKYIDSTGAVNYIGGLGTKYDGILSLNQLIAVMAADSLMTPQIGTGFLPIFTLSLTTGTGITALTITSGFVTLSGGTGGGTQTLAFADYQQAIDSLIDVPFDIGHLVGAYDGPSQAYADGQAQQVATLGYLRSWVHQCQVSGASATQTKVQNSAAVVASGTAAAAALNSRRSSMCAQQVLALNVATGQSTLVDGAWVYAGLLALIGATGPNGPSSPLTYEYPATVASVDYQVLRTTGDMDLAVAGGLVVFERVNYNGLGSVRIVQSVTTQPNDASGNPWYFAEVSVQRCSDALQANIKGALESNNPKVIGTGATPMSLVYALTVVYDLLQQALNDNWIVSFSQASISITPVGTTGNDFIVAYGANPVLPINHLGLDQTFEPFQVPVSIGGTVNGN